VEAEATGAKEEEKEEKEAAEEEEAAKLRDDSHTTHAVCQWSGHY
jgi:hypothetical protein